MQPGPTPDNRSIGDLIRDLSTHASALIRQEVDLAQAEMRQSVVRLTRDMAMLLIGGFIAFLGFLGLLAAGVIALAQVLPAWLAAVIGGGGLALIGIIVIIIGSISLRRTNLVPSRTIGSLQKSATSLRERVSA